MRIKRFGLAIIVLLFIVGATGCFKQESEKKIIGYRVTKEIGRTNVTASEKISGAEIVLSGNVPEKEILTSGNLLKIVKYKDGNTIVSIAGDINTNTKMVEILSNADIMTVNTISEVKCDIGPKRAGETLLGDFDLSGAVDLADFQAFAQSYGTFKVQHDIAPASIGTGDWQNIYCYSTPDKLVDLTDFIIFAKNYGKKIPAVMISRSLEATKLLNYINSLKGTKTLSGEHEFNFDNMSYMGAVAGITGKYPAVYETELAMTAGESPARAVELRNYVVEKSIKWWNQGGIVALTWHECLPGSDIQDFAHSQAKCTQEEFNQIVTPGTQNYNLLIAEIDEIAVYLKKLKDANVPILWRPYHEMNGGWFWWGTKTNYTALWNILYDRLTNYHDLNNLIWVFSPNARTYPEIQPYSQFYPGDSKVDILSEDAYVGNNTEFKQVWQDELVTLGAGKPVAWSEVGVLPTAEQLNGMYRNSIWFSCWRQYLTDSNTCAQIADLYSDSRVITRDEVPRLYADSYVPITYPPGPAPVLPPAGNIVKNPGFESGTTSWGLGKVYTLDTTDKHSGNSSIKLTGNSTWDNLLQYAVPCLPQTNYTVSFWAKSMTNLTTLRIYNADWTARIVQIDTTPNGVWTKYSAKFNSMYFTGLMIDFKDSSTGITFIDDIEIIPSDTPQITLPVAPSDLTATSASTTQINLSWKDNANNETGFNIENSTNGVDFVNIATVGSDITAYSNINLQSNTTYYFRVTAFNSAGNSGLSNVASAKTAQPNTQNAKYEAENGVLTGIEKMTSLTGFSGTGYVGGFDTETDTLTINVAADDATYNLIVGYASPSTAKNCRLSVNSVSLGDKTLPLSTVFTELTLGKVKLNAGNNQITISSGWGWYYIDYITIEKETETPTPSLTSIAVTKQPTKTSYNIGEASIDLTGLVVTGTYSDNTTKVETVTSGAISGFSTTTAGTKTITVKIGTKTTTFTLNVVNVVITKAIIIDHTSTDLSKVPSTWITNAKQVLKIGYGHASHGSQIITGMKAMKGATGSLLDYTISSSGYNANYFMNDYGFAGATDLGNPNRTQWEVSTRNVLNTAGCNRNVVMWSWCGQANTGNPADITLYLNLMNKLEADYPNIKFVYMTGHLAGSGATGNLNLRNQQIRDYCIANNKILYDFADIESYDPDGITNYMTLKANDGCDYDSDNNGSLDKNWATSWVAANPNHELTKLAALSGTPAHTQNLNGILKARAFWWLAARLAGWDGK